MKKLLLAATMLIAFAVPSFAQDGKEACKKSACGTAAVQMAQDGKNASKSKSSCAGSEQCCPAMKESKVANTPKKPDAKAAKKKAAPARVASSSAV